MRFALFVLTLSFALFAVGCGCTTQIDPGEVGVAVSWGEVQPWVYPEGFHFKDPFGMHVERMSTRTQAYEMGNSGSPSADQDGPESTIERGEAVEVLASDQLAVQLSCTVQFHLNPVSAPSIFRYYGASYADTIVHPIVRTAVRDAASEFTAMNLIDQRSALQTRMETLVLTRIEEALASRDIPTNAVVVENILLQNIDLPEALDQAIAAVQNQRQETAQMEQRLLTAQAEANRLQTEANGIAAQRLIQAHAEADSLMITAQANADANRLATASLSPSVLEARRIDAFRAVVSSTATRTLFIPTSMTSLRLSMPADVQ